ncbi:IclR family transcriptional regulator [Arthrobacter sp. MMS18-M83]|uniref:IclR family transcriptional regulator n=1 Tax=Arthrobacter sp. MMS18-M83 TaxID=2996261 RepID=UPI00227CB468|nr:IclR family transcriptional regulator [Arthrobacter sp. MMS18-M83]WAH96326.1 IclR family transcriptional regulator [Arthrobacter sp. MMS18-M83]
MTTTPLGESVITRVARILASFDRQNRSMPLTVLAERAGLPVPTAYRLVTELVRHGLLERDESKQIRIGLRLWELSTRGSDTLSLRDTALPYMEDLFESLGKLTTLSVLEGRTLLYVERLTPGGLNLNRALVAQRHPVHAASSGLVLLAYATPEFQAEFLSRPLARYTPDTVTDPDVLRKMLADIRQRRCCIAPGIGTAGWTGMAVPVFGPGNRVAAALSVVYELGTERPTEAIPAMQAASFGISMALGAQPPRRD